ncbi:hypothetical protein [Rubricoccus marinus]|nr:hypothetical protein [Rubricoccus marinus]
MPSSPSVPRQRPLASADWEGPLAPSESEVGAGERIFCQSPSP